MSEIFLPFKPRRDDPLGFLPVQENVETLAGLFTVGGADGDVLTWDEASGKWVAGAATPANIADGTTAGRIAIWDTIDARWEETSLVTVDVAGSELELTSAMKIVWNADTNVYRAAAGELKTDGKLTVAGTEISLGGDAVLTRDAADVFKTVDQFIAEGAITTKTKAGVPTDSDTAADVDGTIILDETNDRLYVRSNGAWIGVQLGTAPGFGTALPGSPKEGQEFTLVDSVSAPTYAFQMKFISTVEDGATDYRWICIGGFPYYQYVSAATTRASASFGDAADAADPAFTIPVAGYYDITVSAEVRPLGDTTPNQAWVSFRVGATGAVDDDGAQSGEVSGTNIQATHTVFAKTRKLCAASDVIEMQHRADTADSYDIANRKLTAHAVRLAG